MAPAVSNPSCYRTLNPELWLAVLPFLVAHTGDAQPWRPRTHWGWCGQSCPCCRAQQIEDWPTGCQACIDAWTLTTLSKVFRELLPVVARQHACALEAPRRNTCRVSRKCADEGRRGAAQLAVGHERGAAQSAWSKSCGAPPLAVPKSSRKHSFASQERETNSEKGDAL